MIRDGYIFAILDDLRSITSNETKSICILSCSYNTMQSTWNNHG